MMKISSSTFISVITKILILMFVAKSISLGIWYYLGSEGVELSSTKNYQPQYQRVDFRYMIEKEKRKKKEKKVVKKSVSGPSITSMTLKGLYGKGESGFAIVALKSSPKKTSIISVGEVYSGYTLDFIRLDSVVFKKDDKDYILELKNSKLNAKKVQKTSRHKNRRMQEQADIYDDEPRGVSRKDINYFAKHPKEIWRNISIHQVKKHNKIIGFKVTKINPKSKFAMLGLKRGDLITQANNIKLNSYKNAIDIYNKIDTIDTMQIVVIRNNEEKELIYDIN